MKTLATLPENKDWYPGIMFTYIDTKNDFVNPM